MWGSPTNDPEDWDDEAYFFVEGACEGSVVEIPTLGGWGLAALTLMLAALGARFVRRQRLAR